jgi:hypothetical protein
MKEKIVKKASVGYFRILPSKISLFRIFQRVHNTAEAPTYTKSKLAPSSCFKIARRSNTESGPAGQPATEASKDQTNEANGHWNKR